MTFEGFDKYQAELLAKVVEMRNTKAKEYAHSEERFANFNNLALELDLPRLKVAWVFTKKHLDSIISYIKEGKEFSNETIQGRIVDAITYLTLIGGMIEESKVIDIIDKDKSIGKIVASNMDGEKCLRCGLEFRPNQAVLELFGEKIERYHKFVVDCGISKVNDTK